MSTDECCRRVTFALPMSPLVLNFTPSFVTEMSTARGGGLHQRLQQADGHNNRTGEAAPVSPIEERSLQMRWNSAELILMVAAYSVSGMPRCSLSMSMSLSSNSEILSCSAGGGRRAARGQFRFATFFLGLPRRQQRGASAAPRAAACAPWLSNMKVTTSPVSSAFMVMMSSLSAHLSILLCDAAGASKRCESLVPNADDLYERGEAAGPTLRPTAEPPGPFWRERN